MTPKRAQGADQLDGDEVPGVMLQRIFGENFKAARIGAGLSQQEVADLSGVNRVEVSKIERGMVNLTLRTMDRLAKVVDHGAVHLLQEASPSKRVRRS